MWPHDMPDVEPSPSAPSTPVRRYSKELVEGLRHNPYVGALQPHSVPPSVTKDGPDGSSGASSPPEGTLFMPRE